MTQYRDIFVFIVAAHATETRKGVPVSGTPFAVHKMYGSWRVTHQPSGLLLCKATSRKHAIVIATALSAHFQIDWPKECKAHKAGIFRMLKFLGANRDGL